MFEYAVSAGEGTLIDYGVKSDPALERIWLVTPSENRSENDIAWNVQIAGTGEKTRHIFRPASSDCTTGQ